MSEPQWQTCPKCGERWWDSHVCRNTLNSLKVALAPTCQFCGQASRTQPAQAGQVLTDDRLLAMWEGTDGERALRPTLGKNKILSFARAIEQAVLAKRVPMTDDTALIRQLAAALDRCRFDSLNMSVADMRALSEARTAASKRLCIVGEKGGA